MTLPLIEKRIELARKLPAHILHLLIRDGPFEDHHDSAGVGSGVDVHLLALADFFQELVQRGWRGAVRRLPVKVLGQLLRKLRGKLALLSSGCQVISEHREGRFDRPLRFGERVELRQLSDPIYKPFVLHAFPRFLSSTNIRVLWYPHHSGSQRRGRYPSPTGDATASDLV